MKPSDLNMLSIEVGLIEDSLVGIREIIAEAEADKPLAPFAPVVMIEPHATLQDFKCIQFGAYGEGCYLTGRIFDDRKGRWGDGTFIHTSSVERFSPDMEYAFTRNSIYKLGTPA